jgi:multiple sugar transport system substrate-binding protein
MVRSLVILLLALAGCGSASDKTVLRVWDWWSPVEGEKMRDYFRGVKETFEREHPGVDLRFQHIPFGPQYIQKIMASMAAKRPPDCLHASIIWANDLYERGVLSDLRPYVERTPEMADAVWLPAALRYGRDGNYIYGIPIEQDASCIVYNLDLFEQAGISTAPFVFETWEDLRQAAIRMTKRDANGKVIRAGFLVVGGDLSSCLPWMYSDGGAFYTPDLKRSAFNDTAMREAMQFLQDLQYRDRVSFPVATERQDFQYFVQGQVAMFLGGTWVGHLIDEQVPNFRYGMMSFPRGPHGAVRGGMTWTNLMCIPKGAKHPDLAWEFITDYCGMRNALWKLKVIDRNSPLAGFYQTPEWNAATRRSPSLETVPHITEIGGLYPVVRFTEIDAVFQPLCQGLMLDRLRPDQVVSEAQVKVDQILDRYYAQLEEAYR